MTLLRIVALAALALGSARAQTTVADTVSQRPGFGWTGTVTISWPAFTTAAGNPVAAGQTQTTVTNGALSVSLWPSAGATWPAVGLSPAGPYTAVYLTATGSDRGRQWQEIWNVPATSPASLSDVRRASSLSGNTIYSGTTVPADAMGMKGDFYLRNPGTAPCMYGPKPGATWPGTCTSLIGPVGSVPPSSAGDQALITTAANTPVWVSLADCAGSGRALRYVTATHTFSCPALTSGDIPDLSLLYEAKDSTILRASNFGGSGSASTVAHSDHNHAGVYEPIDITLLRQSSLAGSGVALTPAHSDHTHTGVYESASTNGGALAAGTYCMTVNGSSVKTWGVCPSGGGGGAILSWATLTNSDWTSMSNAQWTSMAN